MRTYGRRMFSESCRSLWNRTIIIVGRKSTFVGRYLVERPLLRLPLSRLAFLSLFQ
jgi:hypothetical protein